MLMLIIFDVTQRPRFSLFSMASIELSESVYTVFPMSWMLPLVVPLFWWCLQILLQIQLSFLCSLIRQCRLPCYYCDFLCVVRSSVFSRCHSLYVFLHHSRILCLPSMGAAVSGLSILSPSIFPYNFVPVILSTLPQVLLIFHFFIVLVLSAVQCT